MIKPPFSYSGNKYSALKNGLLPLLIGDYHTIVDAMVGSGAVAYNVSADRVIAIDNSPAIISMHRAVSNPRFGHDLRDLLSSFFDRIPEGNNASGYYQLREHENSLSHGWSYERALALVVLSHLSFNSLIRFGPNGFNAPVGMKPLNVSNLLTAAKVAWKIEFKLEKSFADFDKSLFGKGVLLYFDPPYITTKYKYDGWTREKEQEMLDLILEAERAGADFVLSNVTKYRGEVNQPLIDWIDENGFNVVATRNGGFNAWAAAVKTVESSSKTVEVAITNRSVE